MILRIGNILLFREAIRERMLKQASLPLALHWCARLSVLSGIAREEKAELRFWKRAQLLMFVWSATLAVTCPRELKVTHQVSMLETNNSPMPGTI